MSDLTPDTLTALGIPELTKKELRARKKMFAQQQKRTGFSDEDLWSLDITIAEFILPRLIRFKEIINSYPAALTRKRWDNKLNDMIVAFNVLANTDRPVTENDSLVIERGLKQFYKWFEYLWD